MPGRAIVDSITTPQPLTVLVAGAGIGGLTTALGLRRQGHVVHVFEQSRLANEVGAAIHVAPNSNRILRKFGLFLEQDGGHRYHPTDYGGVTEYDENAGVINELKLPAGVVDPAGAPYFLMHRAHLHAAIRDKAVEEGVVLHTACKVKTVNPEDAEMTLENGEVWKGDVLVGADGVNSRTRALVHGGEKIKPFSSGRSGFRFLVPADKVRSSPVLSPLGCGDGKTIKMHLGNGLIFVAYPCVSNTVMNCFAICPTEVVEATQAQLDAEKKSSTSTKEVKMEVTSTNKTKDASSKLTAGEVEEPCNPSRGWNSTASKELMMRIFSQVGPVAHGVLSLAGEDGIGLWTLMDMNTLPTWVERRLVLIGDAAHPFTPWLGQGGAMAIEDAASLAAVLPLGTQPEDVAERLELYQRLRRDRATEIQDISRKSGGELWNTRRKLPGLEKFNFAKYNQKVFFHDEWAHSSAALANMLQGTTGQATMSQATSQATSQAATATVPATMMAVNA